MIVTVKVYSGNSFSLNERLVTARVIGDSQHRNVPSEAEENDLFFPSRLLKKNDAGLRWKTS